jgi:succinoglycan biosynthesis transport protein ExoP
MQKLPPPVTVRDVALILRRRALLALFTFVVVVGATLYFTSRMPKVYEAESRVLLDSTIDATAATPASVLELVTGRSSNSLDTEMEKIKARSFLAGVIRDANLPYKETERLKNSLTLDAGPGGQILDISAKSDTPQTAKRIADVTAKNYIALARREFREKADLSQERLKEAAAKALDEKREAERLLNAFNARVGLSDPSILYRSRATQTVETRNGLEDAQKNLPVQIANLRNLQAALKRIPPTVVTGYPLNKNPVIDDYRTQLYNLETQRKKALFDFAPDSDEVKAIDAEIDARRNAIAEAEKDMFSAGSRSIARNSDYGNIQSKIYDASLGILGTRIGIAAMQRRLATLEAEQKRFAVQQIAYEGLKRKREGANEAYEQARLGLIRMEMTRVMSAPNLKVLEDAYLPEKPVSPKPLLNLIMALCLGLFLGAGMALLAEYLAAGSVAHDYAADLPQVGGVPLLGTLPVSLPGPAARNPDGLPVPLRYTARTEDALREIGFVLVHRHPKDPVPVVLLTGTRSDDTTAGLAAQLAATLVRDGVRVTLVDADRSEPRLNRVFGAPDAPGIADVLAGRARVKDILHVGAGGNLRFLAAGSPDDATPLTEVGLRALFRDLADHDTDVILISGPSVWQAPLVGPLEKAAGGMVLVAPDAEHGIPPAESVARARRILSNGYKPHILGVVVGTDEDLVSAGQGEHS